MKIPLIVFQTPVVYPGFSFNIMTGVESVAEGFCRRFITRHNGCVELKQAILQGNANAFHRRKAHSQGRRWTTN